MVDIIKPKSHIVNTSFSVDTSKEIAPQVVSHLYDTGRRQLTIDLDGQTIYVPITEDDIFIPNENEIKSYGEGADPTKVIADGAKWLMGETLELDFYLRPYKILDQLPIDDSNYAYIQNGILHNCDSGRYNFEIDEAKLASLATLAFKQSEILSISLADLAVSRSEANIIQLCSQSEDAKPQIVLAFQKVGLDVPRSLEYDTNSNKWKVSQIKEITDSLSLIKAKTDVPVLQGKYELSAGKVLLLQPYRIGSSLNVGKSLESIQRWLELQQGEIIFVYDEIRPDVLAYGGNILDFTKHVGAGRTRLDIIRFGAANLALTYAQHGLEDVHNIIIQPGQEFSYIDTIKPQPGGWTASGRPIGGGICNSTTTLFRAALEAGFPITERSYHRTYIPSYEWPYPKNVVDSVYLTEPEIDLKFINDLDYPVLLRLTVTRPGGNWQYHTIDVLTDSRARDRNVKLYGFRTWNHATPKQFEGEFRRKVYDDGVLKRQDKFYSRYIDDGGVN